jgi:long-chain acyl-CoA synthetase
MTVTSPYDYLEATARRQPDALALVTRRSTFTFAELRRASRNLGGILREYGVRPGDIVATQVSADFEWLLTLALIHEGAVTCSVWDAAQVRIVAPALFITETPMPETPMPETPMPETPMSGAQAVQTLVVDEAWLGRAIEEENAYQPVPFSGDDAMVRLVLTSGTTGTPKLARSNLGSVIWRNDNLDKFWTPGVYLNLLGLPTVGAFYQGMAHLAQAMPYLVPDAINARTVQLIVDYGVNFIAGSPLNAGQLCDVLAGVDEATAAAVASTVASVIVMGSTPGDRLITAIRAHFGVDARLVYGSTEGGAVTTRIVAEGDDPRNVGHPYPGVVLQIVDERGQALPAGETGFLRYKTLDMFDGYFRDFAATAAVVRDGWFYPGDTGLLLTDGQLVLAGRTEEILNVGGVKLDPLEIDRAVMALPGVVDAAAFVVERLGSTPRLAVAVVGDSSLDLAEIDAGMRRHYPTRYPSVSVATDVIPRNDAGKVRRGELESYFADAAPASSPGAQTGQFR